MANKDNKNKNKEAEKADNGFDEKFAEFKNDFKKSRIYMFIAIILAIASPFASAWVSGFMEDRGQKTSEMIDTYGQLPQQLEDMEDTLTDISSDLEEIKELQIRTKFDDYDKMLTQMNDRLNLIDSKFANVYLKLSFTNNYKIEHVVVKEEYYLTAPKWTRNDIIAKDLTCNRAYSAEQLYNMPMLVPYMEENQEVYFYGQFNENNHWDGRCIINTYENNQLLYIMDATYDDGKLLDYKQVMKRTDKDEWIVSDRKNEGSYNSGKTMVFALKDEFTKSFTMDNVTNIMILNVDDFLQSLNSPMIGYYSGNTSGGLYNDDTGNAYLVKYNADGKVKLIYQGCFVDGQFKDSTNNAWSIACEENTKYMYYRGHYSEGKPLRNEGFDFQNELTQEQINAYLNGKNFDCELIWDTSKMIIDT